MIYHDVLAPEALCIGAYDTIGSLSPPTLACVNRMIRAETLPIFYRKNKFSLRFTKTRDLRHRTLKWKMADQYCDSENNVFLRLGAVRRLLRRLERTESGPELANWAICMPIDLWSKYTEMFECFKNTDGLQHITSLEICYYEPTWDRKFGCKISGSSSSGSSLDQFGDGDMDWQDQDAVVHAVDQNRRAICRRCSVIEGPFRDQDAVQRLVDTIRMATRRSTEAAKRVELVWDCACLREHARRERSIQHVLGIRLAPVSR